MNAPMQQLFMIPAFRSALLSIDQYRDAGEPADMNESLLYQLQLLFAMLQESEQQSCSPGGVCHAFKDMDGKPTDVRIQDDSGSFLLKLLDRLCMTTKGSAFESAIPSVLGGVLCHELIGKNDCPHYRDRSEDFYGLSLEVQNKRTLTESLSAFIEGEVLEGGNQYKCDVCLTGDHRVLTRRGWRSITEVQEGEEVLSFHKVTYAQEWKAVTGVVAYAINPRKEDDTLYRMQGSGMDVVATRDHRMLLARLTQRTEDGLQGETPVDYETVDELLAKKYACSNNSTVTRFEHNSKRAVVRGGFNRQPGVKIDIPGLERVCQWWWEKDGQMGWLRFLGFWLGDGHLLIAHKQVAIGQRKLLSTEWLIDLLDSVFPRWWYRDVGATDANGTTYYYRIRCPPLYDYLRAMAAGPKGYNPRDPSALRSYPHFTCDEELAAEEAKSRYRQQGATPIGKWTEAEMLAVLTAGPVQRLCVVCQGEGKCMLVCSGLACGPVDCITRAHPACVDAPADRCWYCPGCARSTTRSLRSSSPSETLSSIELPPTSPASSSIVAMDCADPSTSPSAALPSSAPAPAPAPASSPSYPLSEDADAEEVRTSDGEAEAEAEVEADVLPIAQRRERLYAQAERLVREGGYRFGSGIRIRGGGGRPSALSCIAKVFPGCAEAEAKQLKRFLSTLNEMSGKGQRPPFHEYRRRLLAIIACLEEGKKPKFPPPFGDPRDAEPLLVYDEAAQRMVYDRVGGMRMYRCTHCVDTCQRTQKGAVERHFIRVHMEEEKMADDDEEEEDDEGEEDEGEEEQVYERAEEVDGEDAPAVEEVVGEDGEAVRIPRAEAIVDEQRDEEVGRTLRAAGKVCWYYQPPQRTARSPSSAGGGASTTRALGSSPPSLSLTSSPSLSSMVSPSPASAPAPRFISLSSMLHPDPSDPCCVICGLTERRWLSQDRLTSYWYCVEHVFDSSQDDMDAEELALMQVMHGDEEEDVPMEWEEDGDAPFSVVAPSVIIPWNNGLWIIINGHWFYLKRWLGDEQQISSVYSQLSREQAIALLDGFCRADGTWTTIQYDEESGEPTGQWICSNSSFPLIDHLQLIGQLAGAAVDLVLAIEAGKTTTIEGRTVKFTVEHWQLFFTFTKSARGIPFPHAPLARPVDVTADIDARGYYQYEDDGRVYDISVEGNSNFLTQRLSNKRLKSGGIGTKAHSVFVGNCQKKVDTIKRTCIRTLPPSLFFILKRFQLDYNTLETLKINDRLEFPHYVDMRPYCKDSLPLPAGATPVPDKNGADEEGKGKEAEAKREDGRGDEYYQYVLRGIVVHTGSANGGHYYSFIQERGDVGSSSSNAGSPPPTGDSSEDEGRWLKMNDSVVTFFDPKDIPDEAFGGVEEAPVVQQPRGTHANKDGAQQQQQQQATVWERYRNAYILFYDRVRKPVDIKKANQAIAAQLSAAPVVAAPPAVRGRGPLAKSSSSSFLSALNGSSKVVRSLARVPSAMYEMIWKQNMAHWRDRAVYDGGYFSFLYKLIVDAASKEPKRRFSTPRTSSAAAAGSADSLDAVMARLSSLSVSDGSAWPQHRVCELATRFFLVTFARARLKESMAQWVALLKRLYADDVLSSMWLLHLFTINNGAWIREYLWECPDTPLRNHIADLLGLALSNVVPLSLHLFALDGPKPVLWRDEVGRDGEQAPTPPPMNYVDVERGQYGAGVALEFGYALVAMLDTSAYWWRTFDSYFRLFAHFAASSPVVARWLVRPHGMVGRLLDFFLGEQSLHPELNALPLNLHTQKRLPMRDEYNTAEWHHFLALIATLIQQCRQPQSLPVAVGSVAAALPQLASSPEQVPLSEKELALLLYPDLNNGFLVHLLQLASGRKKGVIVSSFVVHLCRDNPPVSEVVLACIRRGLEWFDWDNVRSYFRVLSALAQLKDSLQPSRVNHLTSMLLDVIAKQAKFWKITDMVNATQTHTHAHASMPSTLTPAQQSSRPPCTDRLPPCVAPVRCSASSICSA